MPTIETPPKQSPNSCGISSQLTRVEENHPSTKQDSVVPLGGKLSQGDGVSAGSECLRESLPLGTLSHEPKMCEILTDPMIGSVAPDKFENKVLKASPNIRISDTRAEQN